MMKNYLAILFALIFCGGVASAQVTTHPTPLQEDSRDVTIYFHADQGNKGLINLPADTKIYAHTGVITNQSSGPTDWKYTVADWNVDTPKCQLVYESENLWSLYLGDIRSFYGITDPSVTVEKLAFVFRTSGGSKEGKTTDGGDIFVEVVDTGLQITLTDNIHTDIVSSSTGEVTFTVSCTMNANLSISVNGIEIASKNDVNSLTTTYTFKEVGEYKVTAEAKAGEESVSVTNTYTFFGDPIEMAYPGGGKPVMGPVTNPDGSVTFCVAAPGMDRMVIVGSWNDYDITNDQLMYYTDYETLNPVTGESVLARYFWITIDGIGATTDKYVYFFMVNGTVTDDKGDKEYISTNTCDPYARLILDPWNDKYLDTDVFPGLPSYPSRVVDGVPVAIYQSNINDYDWQVEDFEGPDKTNLIIYELLFRDFTGTEGKAYGNGTVRQAIEKFDYLKELGINAIEVLPIMEFSGNISWGYNPNFYFAVDKAYGTPADYKEFIDLCHQNGIAVILDMVFNQSDGLHPWYQMYGGTQFSPFYNETAPHAYSVLNDWNQGYPLVQQQWADVIRYWMEEYKFDGFRFDLVKGLGLNSSYANNGDSATNEYNASRVAEMRWLQTIVDSINPDAYFINENLAYAKEENEMAESGQLNWSNLNYAACQVAMGYESGSGLNGLFAPLNDGRLKGSTVSYLESHDEQRLAYKQDQWGQAGAVKGNVEASMQRLGMTAAQMLMTPGSHMIWQFSEMGNAQNTKTDIGNDTDPKIVNWSLLDEPNHKGLFDSYRDMIEIRFNNPEFFTMDVDPVMNCSESDWANGRSILLQANGKELYTFMNPNYKGTLTMKVDFANKDNNAYKILSRSYNSNVSFNAEAGTVTLPANCYMIVGNADLSGAGIENVMNESSNMLRVYGGIGEIVIDNAYGGASVYSLEGRLVGSVKESGKISVSSGFYIVRAGNNAIKIMVR